MCLARYIQLLVSEIAVNILPVFTDQKKTTFKVDLIDISKREFTPAILFSLEVNNAQLLRDHLVGIYTNSYDIAKGPNQT